MDNAADTRSLAQLAKEVIELQDACSLSGVVLTFARSISRLRVILRAEGRESTPNINTHPICILWASKIASLTGLPQDLNVTGDDDVFSKAYRVCRQHANEFETL
jgi:hypothetical protein